MELHYKQIGDYLYPNLELPEHTDYVIGKYGKLHLEYLKKHRRGTYSSLLMEGKLNEYLHGIDVQVAELLNSVIVEHAKKNGINEELKAVDQMRWIQEMNNLKACAEEIVLQEVVYR